MNTNNKLTINEVARARKRLLQMHYESGVGHIGGNLSALDAALLIFHEYLSTDDRFILSKGHAAGALYVCLWSIGRLTDADLKQFHKDNTLLAGHPPAKGLDDVLFATGSLGHGLSLAAGTALAFQMQQKHHNVFCLTSDGEWQEGSMWEALIFATHHKLKNLVVLVDHNNLQGFGSTEDVASMSPLWEKLQGFDLDIHVVDGHDHDAIRHAISAASTKMKMVILQTIKGKGVSFMENKMAWHYLPLTQETFQQAIEEVDAQ